MQATDFIDEFPIDLFHDPAHIPLAPTFGAKLGSERRRCETMYKRLCGRIAKTYP